MIKLTPNIIKKFSRIDSGNDQSMGSCAQDTTVSRSITKITELKMESVGSKSIRQSKLTVCQKTVEQRHHDICDWKLSIAALLPVLLLPLCPFIIFSALYLSLYSTSAIAISVAYMSYVWLDTFVFKTHLRGGRPWRILRRDRMLFRYGAAYFPVKLVRDRGNGTVVTTEMVRSESCEAVQGDKWLDVDPNGSFLFAIHPHGVLGQGVWCSFSNEATGFHHLFPKMGFRVATLNLNFFLPCLRDYFLMQGFVSAGKESLLSYLGKTCPSRDWEIQEGKTQRGLGLVVGGAEESFLSEPGRNSLVLRRRRGFVRYALQTGSYLVPVYCFQHNSIYRQLNSPMLRRAQVLFKQYLSFAPIIFVGRFLWLPFKKELTTVVGQPIQLPQIPNPSADQISHYHNLYIEALEKLFNDFKDVYDPLRTEELTIT